MSHCATSVGYAIPATYHSSMMTIVNDEQFKSERNELLIIIIMPMRGVQDILLDARGFISVN